MNSKQIKKLRKRVKPLQLEWLKTLLSDSEFQKITLRNINEFLPRDTHVIAGNQVYLAFMSDKWVIKNLKRNTWITSFKDIQKIIKEKY